MSHSESIVNLSKALFQFQGRISKIQKDSNNPFFKSKYASLSHILDNINPLLIEHGILIMQHPVDGQSADVVSLSTMIVHAETGEYLESVFSMSPTKKDPQGIGSCITYMRRYALVSILKLNVDEDDDDGNAASASAPASAPASARASASVPSFVLELKDKISIAQSADELSKLVPNLQDANISDHDRKTLRQAYKLKLESFKGAE